MTTIYRDKSGDVIRTVPGTLREAPAKPAGKQAAPAPAAAPMPTTDAAAPAAVAKS